MFTVLGLDWFVMDPAHPPRFLLYFSSCTCFCLASTSDYVYVELHSGTRCVYARASASASSTPPSSSGSSPSHPGNSTVQSEDGSFRATWCLNPNVHHTIPSRGHAHRHAQRHPRDAEPATTAATATATTTTTLPEADTGTYREADTHTRAHAHAHAHARAEAGEEVTSVGDIPTTPFFSRGNTAQSLHQPSSTSSLVICRRGRVLSGSGPSLHTLVNDAALRACPLFDRDSADVVLTDAATGRPKPLQARAMGWLSLRTGALAERHEDAEDACFPVVYRRNSFEARRRSRFSTEWLTPEHIEYGVMMKAKVDQSMHAQSREEQHQQEQQQGQHRREGDVYVKVSSSGINSSEGESVLSHTSTPSRPRAPPVMDPPVKLTCFIVPESTDDDDDVDDDVATSANDSSASAGVGVGKRRSNSGGDVDDDADAPTMFCVTARVESATSSSSSSSSSSPSPSSSSSSSPSAASATAYTPDVRRAPQGGDGIHVSRARSSIHTDPNAPLGNPLDPSPSPTSPPFPSLSPSSPSSSSASELYGEIYRIFENVSRWETGMDYAPDDILVSMPLHTAADSDVAVDVATSRNPPSAASSGQYSAPTSTSTSTPSLPSSIPYEPSRGNGGAGRSGGGGVDVDADASGVPYLDSRPHNDHDSPDTDTDTTGRGADGGADGGAGGSNRDGRGAGRRRGQVTTVLSGALIRLDALFRHDRMSRLSHDVPVTSLSPAPKEHQVRAVYHLVNSSLRDPAAVLEYMASFVDVSPAAPRASATRATPASSSSGSQQRAQSPVDAPPLVLLPVEAELRVLPRDIEYELPASPSMSLPLPPSATATSATSSTSLVEGEACTSPFQCPPTSSSSSASSSSLSSSLPSVPLLPAPPRLSVVARVGLTLRTVFGLGLVLLIVLLWVVALAVLERVWAANGGSRMHPETVPDVVKTINTAVMTMTSPPSSSSSSDAAWKSNDVSLTASTSTSPSSSSSSSSSASSSIHVDVDVDDDGVVRFARAGEVHLYFPFAQSAMVQPPSPPPVHPPPAPLSPTPTRLPTTPSSTSPPSSSTSSSSALSSPSSSSSSLSRHTNSGKSEDSSETAPVLLDLHPLIVPFRSNNGNGDGSSSSNSSSSSGANGGEVDLLLRATGGNQTVSSTTSFISLPPPPSPLLPSVSALLIRSLRDLFAYLYRAEAFVADLITSSLPPRPPQRSTVEDFHMLAYASQTMAASAQPRLVQPVAVEYEEGVGMTLSVQGMVQLTTLLPSPHAHTHLLPLTPSPSPSIPSPSPLPSPSSSLPTPSPSASLHTPIQIVSDTPVTPSLRTPSFITTQFSRISATPTSSPSPSPSSSSSSPPFSSPPPSSSAQPSLSSPVPNAFQPFLSSSSSPSTSLPFESLVTLACSRVTSPPLLSPPSSAPSMSSSSSPSSPLLSPPPTIASRGTVDLLRSPQGLRSLLLSLMQAAQQAWAAADHATKQAKAWAAAQEEERTKQDLRVLTCDAIHNSDNNHHNNAAYCHCIAPDFSPALAVVSVDANSKQVFARLIPRLKRQSHPSSSTVTCAPAPAAAADTAAADTAAADTAAAVGASVMREPPLEAPDGAEDAESLSVAQTSMVDLARLLYYVAAGALHLRTYANTGRTNSDTMHSGSGGESSGDGGNVEEKATDVSTLGWTTSDLTLLEHLFSIIFDLASQSLVPPSFSSSSRQAASLSSSSLISPTVYTNGCPTSSIAACVHCHCHPQQHQRILLRYAAAVSSLQQHPFFWPLRRRVDFVISLVNRELFEPASANAVPQSHEMRLLLEAVGARAFGQATLSNLSSSTSSTSSSSHAIGEMVASLLGEEQASRLTEYRTSSLYSIVRLSRNRTQHAHRDAASGVYDDTAAWREVEQSMPNLLLSLYVIASISTDFDTLVQAGEVEDANPHAATASTTSTAAATSNVLPSTSLSSSSLPSVTPASKSSHFSTSAASSSSALLSSSAGAQLVRSVLQAQARALARPTMYL